jgi:cohesin complex subunit SA-1/2
VTAGRQQRVRRAAAAASAPSPSAAKTPKRGRGKGNSAKTATTPTATTPKGGAAAADAADSVLFAALLSGRDTVSAVDAWAGRYAADAKKGLAELLTFLIRCCGCRETFTLQMLKYEQAKVVDLLTQDFNGDGTAYPLQQASAPFKNFRRQLTDFIKTLVLALQVCMRFLIIYLLGFFLLMDGGFSCLFWAAG